MSFTDERDSRRRRKAEPHDSAATPPARPKKKRPPPGEVGQALRSAYDRVVEEDIPPEMIDLLGKLG